MFKLNLSLLGLSFYNLSWDVLDNLFHLFSYSSAVFCLFVGFQNLFKYCEFCFRELLQLAFPA